MILEWIYGCLFAMDGTGIKILLQSVVCVCFMSVCSDFTEL